MKDVDPDEARRLLLDELSEGQYAHRQNILERLWGMLRDLLDALLQGDGGSPAAGTAVAVVVVLLALALAVVLLRRRGMLRRKVALREEIELTADAAVPAEELRRRAGAAVLAGRHDDAVVLAMRAIVRDLSERTLLEVTDGMTAHEAAADAGRAFPELRGRLARTADDFDTAAYSRRTASTRQAEAAVRLAEYLAQTSPEASVLEAL